MNTYLINIITLIIRLIVNPVKLFETIDNNRYKLEIYILYFIAALQTFIKSFNINSSTQLNFFSSNILNTIFTFLGLPQIRWLLSYILFCIFIYLTSLLFNKICPKKKSINLYSYFMVVSGIGVVMHPLFILFRYIFPPIFNSILVFSIFIWVMMLYSKAINYLYNASLIYSFIFLTILSVPFFMICGPPSIAPFLSWLMVGVFF